MKCFLRRVCSCLFIIVLASSLTLGSSWSAQKLNKAKLAEMDSAIEEAISQKKMPGGVLYFQHNNEVYRKAFGNRSLFPEEERMTEDTIFDAASLTKVVATTPAIMLLLESGKIHLTDKVQQFIPNFSGQGKEEITILQLLTHTSGLRGDVDLKPSWVGQDRAIELACAERLLAPPGTVFRYSDINFFLLGEIVRRVSGIPLDQFVQQEVYVPLGMKDTQFLPPKAKFHRIAPTEKIGTNVFRGVVHDPTARNMGGVAGHAGLFTTARDLARFANMLLNEGKLGRKRIFKEATVEQMIKVHTPDFISQRRALGWDIDSPYSGPRGKYFPIGSYGHTGWTGTSLWIDPFSKSFVIFLSNRNHPTEEGNVIALRNKLGTLAAEAIWDFNFSYVPGALPAFTNASVSALKQTRVLNGIDVLVAKKFEPLRGKKVGLITNHTGHDRNRNPTIDLLHAADGVQLVALFSPEHGIRGAMDEKITDSTDEKTGLPVFSLYGERRSPTEEQLQGLDVLVFDIQDIGSRFYTYISTLGLCLEAAGKANVTFMVLDRVNPINGLTVEGPVHNTNSSFTAFHSIPVRHGMTVGELARMYNAERKWNAPLEVIKVEGWTRDMWFDQTDLPWTNPSPNMRNLTEAELYPGIGLLESTVSVGRGSDTPFEVIGAPYIDDRKLAAELNRAGLPGIRFVPIRYTPKTSVFKGQECGGVYIFLTDRNACSIVDVGFAITQTLLGLYPKEFALEKFNSLLFNREIIQQLREGKPWKEIKKGWVPDLEGFKKRRVPFLLY